MKKVIPFLLFGAIFIIGKFDKEPVKDEFDQRLLWQAQSAQKNISSYFTTNSYQRGTIYATAEDYQLSERKMHEVVEHHAKGNPAKVSYIIKWKDSQDNVINLSALGVDWKHHFANSYLVGFKPFSVDNLWLPLYAIAQLKTYETDSDQYRTNELWQNSAQAYASPRGDCEDHAIILADWLISEGVDARVVGGKYKGGGHAWVLAIIDDQEFILEATSKRKTKNWNHYPLAKLARDYHPEFMFNREQFWVNTNRKLIDDYRGEHWQITSTYKKLASKPL